MYAYTETCANGSENDGCSRTEMEKAQDSHVCNMQLPRFTFDFEAPFSPSVNNRTLVQTLRDLSLQHFYLLLVLFSTP